MFDKLGLIAVVASALACSSSSPVSPRFYGPQGLTLATTIFPTSAKFGDTVRVTLTVKNNTTESVEVQLFPACPSVLVRTSSGVRIPPNNAQCSASGVEPAFVLQITPGDSIAQSETIRVTSDAETPREWLDYTVGAGQYLVSNCLSGDDGPPPVQRPYCAPPATLAVTN